jgi:hypothetical protein
MPMGESRPIQYLTSPPLGDARLALYISDLGPLAEEQFRPSEYGDDQLRPEPFPVPVHLVSFAKIFPQEVDRSQVRRPELVTKISTNPT